MWYFRRQECGWNTTHTYGFHAAWKRDLVTFTLPSDHDYWKLSWKNAGFTTVTGASEGGGEITTDQRRLDLSKVISHHPREASDAIFSSLITDFSKALENLK